MKQNNNKHSFINTDVKKNDCEQKVTVASQEHAYRAIDLTLLMRNWLIGKRIHDEILKDARKDNYGQIIIKNPSKVLIAMFEDGFSVPKLYYFYSIYTLYKNIFYTVCRQFL